jgi:hypothetical protein
MLLKLLFVNWAAEFTFWAAKILYMILESDFLKKKRCRAWQNQK